MVACGLTFTIKWDYFTWYHSIEYYFTQWKKVTAYLKKNMLHAVDVFLKSNVHFILIPKEKLLEQNKLPVLQITQSPNNHLLMLWTLSVAPHCCYTRYFTIHKYFLHAYKTFSICYFLQMWKQIKALLLSGLYESSSCYTFLNSNCSVLSCTDMQKEKAGHMLIRPSGMKFETKAVCLNACFMSNFPA